MPDFLNLPGIETESVEDHGEDAIRVTAKTVEPAFPRCDENPGLCRFVLNGSKSLTINDTPHGGKAVAISLRRRQAKCRGCGKGGIYEILPHVQERTLMTRRLSDLIGRQCLRRTFAEVARDLHVAANTVRSAFHAGVDERLATLDRKTPRVLGIDEKYLNRQYRAVIGNVDKRTVLDLLPDRDVSLDRWLKDLPDKRTVEVVTIDMYDSYRNLVAKYLPGIPVVVDKFHVVRRANDALNQLRHDLTKEMDGVEKKRLRRARYLFLKRANDLGDKGRERIDEWTRDFPVLHEAYWAKEAFFGMYTCTNRSDAIEYYTQWRAELPRIIAPWFRTKVGIKNVWQEGVFAYFDHPYTNAYVESVNRFLADLNRDGRGYTFEMIRAKFLLSSKLEHQTFRDRSPGAYGPGNTDPLETYRWGADLRLIDEVLNPGLTVVERTPDGWREDSVRTGLSTLEADWLYAG